MKVELRDWRMEDCEQLVALAKNKKIADNLRDRFPHPYTIKDAEKWIRINKSRTPATNFVIEVNGQLAGGCGIQLKEDVYRHSAEIGYWLAEPFWGKGITTEAVRLVLNKVISDFPYIIRLYAEVFENNKASMRVLEKNDFNLESVRKKSVIKNDILMNDHVYAKIIR